MGGHRGWKRRWLPQPFKQALPLPVWGGKAELWALMPGLPLLILHGAPHRRAGELKPPTLHALSYEGLHLFLTYATTCWLSPASVPFSGPIIFSLWWGKRTDPLPTSSLLVLPNGTLPLAAQLLLHLHSPFPTSKSSFEGILGYRIKRTQKNRNREAENKSKQSRPKKTKLI